MAEKEASTKTTFAQRLTQACDDNRLVPEYGKGRQVAIATRLKVSQEAVRKWFTGEAIPKPQKMKQLAAYLDVEETWLALGIKPELDRVEKKENQRVLNGAVHMVAGLILLEGGNIAFPREGDPRAEYVDLYSIMCGTQMALHICVGREVSNGKFELIVPRNFNDVRCIGYMPNGLGKFHLLTLPVNLINEHKQRKSGDFALMINKIGSEYHTGSDTWPKFKTFGEIM